MQAHEIQEIVLKALRSVQARILKSTIYSVSDEPGEIDVHWREEPYCVATAIMSYTQFVQFRSVCNQWGVWIQARWEMFNPHLDTGLFVYEIKATEKRRSTPP